jgi:RNA polymerase sigma-70 factor (ECF subfamily)
VTAHPTGDARWQAFEREAMPHVDRLFRHAMWLEQNREAAEDLVQETLVQALQSFDRYTPGTNCRAWLAAILHNVRANRLRKQGRLPIEPVDDDRIDAVPFEPQIPEGLTDEEMLGALRRLPAAHQEVILLCDVEEMSYKEIATALGVPIGTVMSRLHRGRGMLRAELARAGFRPVEQHSRGEA